MLSMKEEALRAVRHELPVHHQSPALSVDGVEGILRRIPPEWGQSISCDEGWWSLLVELDARLARIDPHYEVQQVEERFGTLWFDAYTERHAQIGPRFDRIIAAAEAASTFMCEKCGAIGGIARRKTWRRTLCDSCVLRHGYVRPAVHEGRTSGRHGAWRAGESV